MLNTLTIKLNTSALEIISSDIVHKLYINVKDIEDNEGLVTLLGNLLTPLAYDNEIAYLNTTYPNLYITAQNQYLHFEDPATEEILLDAGLGDGTGIPISELSTYTRLAPSSTFRRHGCYAKRFNELARMPNIKTLTTEEFIGCYCLESIDLSNIEFISRGAFLGCRGLKSEIYMPNLVTMEKSAFETCSFTTVSNLGHITEILGYTFRDCSKLVTINIPAETTRIGELAFESCTSLTNIDLSNILYIGSLCFRYCSSLTSVDLSSATTINGSAFRDCSSLLSVTLGDGLVTISGYTFNNCPNLTSINIPSSVKTIDDLAFSATPTNLIHGSDIYYVETVLTSTEYSSFATGSFANEDLVLPNLKNLRGRAFGRLAFKTFSAPNLETISNDIFTLGYNDTVTEIHISPNTVVTANYGSRGGGIFASCSNLVKVTGLSLWTECYPALFLSDKNLKYFDIDFTKITRLCGGLFKSDVGSISNYFNSNRIIDFENLVHSYIDNNGSLIYATTIFSCCILSHVLFPKLKETTATKDKNSYGGPNNNFFVLGTKYGRIKNLYFRDIENFGVATFADAIIDNLYLDTSTPPGLISSTGTAATLSGINDDVFFSLRNKTAGTYNGINAPAITIYVPDSAVSTYLANPLYASVASNIVGISNAPVVSLSDITDIIDPDDNDPTITYGQACSVDGILPLYAPARTL